MAVMSTSAVSVALPTIGRDLHASSTSLEWIVDAYVIVFASLLVAGGVLSDRRGRKGMFMTGVTLFGIGSLVGGVAPSVGWLLCGRVIQGLGPAIVTPTSLAIISATFDEPGARAGAIGVWSSGSGLALALGPAVGGLLVDAIGWRSVFLLNVPLALVVIALGVRFIPVIARSEEGARFDWTGAFLTTTGIGLLTFAIIEGPGRGWDSGLILGAFVVAFGALAAFVAWEERHESPLIDVSLFARAPFTVANLAGLAVFFAFIGGIVYLSAYFQQVQGRSALGAGLAVLPVGIGFFVGAPLSGRLVGRFGPRFPMVLGLLLCAAGMLGLVRLQTRFLDRFALVGSRRGRSRRRAQPHPDDRDGDGRGARSARRHGVGDPQFDASGRPGARSGRARARWSMPASSEALPAAGGCRVLRPARSWTGCTAPCWCPEAACWQRPFWRWF